jgi:hypothetical protein
VFRRIEFINEDRRPGNGELRSFKSGLMGASSEAVLDAWFDRLRGPDRTLPWNARFYFTERGWREVGREVVRACGRSGQPYRVIRVKEDEVDVVWRDHHTGYEVAAQPRRRRR